eukprot:5059765-Alexandrium_andersonii.AAC.1
MKPLPRRVGGRDVSMVTETANGSRMQNCLNCGTWAFVQPGPPGTGRPKRKGPRIRWESSQ